MSESAYKQAGVDIEAAADLVESIKPHIRKTKRSGVMSNIGGFGALFDLKATGYQDPVLVSGTDGVGTKIKIAIETNRHHSIGIDAVAMCVNDIVVQGAEPLFFLDYFATGKLDNYVAEQVIKSVAEGCVLAGCALIGGETAEMPGLYAGQDYDLAGFSVGAVERSRLIDGARISEGDVILGLASSGLHSNGFSLVRRIVEGTQGYGYEDPASFTEGKALADFLLTPTRIYVRSLLDALFVVDDKGVSVMTGMAHITGGGLLENAGRMLPDELCASIDVARWDLPPVFRWLMEAGALKSQDMATTLNAGLGMIVICNPAGADEVRTSLEASGERVFDIGVVKPRSDVSGDVELLHMDEHWS